MILTSLISNPQQATSLLTLGGFDDMIDQMGLGSLFGQTSFEEMVSTTDKSISDAFNVFKNAFQTDPSTALSNLSEYLHRHKTQAELGLQNARAKRSKESGRINVESFNKALSKFNQILVQIKKDFNVKATPKIGSYTFKSTKKYTSYVYTLTPKANTSKTSFNDISKISSDPISTTQPQSSKNNTNQILLIGGLFILLKYLKIIK